MNTQPLAVTEIDWKSLIYLCEKLRGFNVKPIVGIVCRPDVSQSVQERTAAEMKRGNEDSGSIDVYLDPKQTVPSLVFYDRKALIAYLNRNHTKES
jgi:hypothetical protein